MRSLGSNCSAVRREGVPEQPDGDEHRHVDEEPRGAHEAGEPLGELGERLRVHPGRRRSARGVPPVAGRGGAPGRRGSGVPHVPSASPPSALSRSASICAASRSSVSRQSSGRMWSSTSSTVTAPSRRVGVVHHGYADQVVGRQVARHLPRVASGDSGSTSVSTMPPTDVVRRLAQHALDVDEAEVPAGRRLQRRAADVDRGRQRRG